VTTAMTAGQLLVGQTGADPLPKTISGAITVAASGAMALADSAVSTAKLKYTSGTVSTATGNARLTLPGGGFGFYPQIHRSNEDYNVSATILWGGAAGYVGGVATSATTYIYLGSANVGTTCTATQTYIQASGPLHWVFLLRRKDTGQVLSMYEAPDHPCYGNGGSPLLVQHPFANVEENRWLWINGQKVEIEIVVINPTDYQVQLADAMGAAVIVGKDAGYMTEDLYLTAAGNLTESGQPHLMSDLEAMVFYYEEFGRPVSQAEAREILMATQGCVLDLSRPRMGRGDVFMTRFNIASTPKPWATTPITVDLPGNGIHNTQVIDWRLSIGNEVKPIRVIVPQPQDINRFAMAVKK